MIKNHEATVLNNSDYPEDKVVSIKIKGTTFYLNVENDNGNAKVADVVIDGKQVVFK